MQGITLIPIASAPSHTTEFLNLTLNETFNVPCRILENDIDIESSYDSERKQYHSTQILAKLLPYAQGNNNHILGIVDVDLFIPILTFVFGEAQLGKQCSLISVTRLHQQFYGLPYDENQFMHRCEKEAIHELGHTLGLTHCQNFECVMHYSSLVEDIDLKSHTFCPNCIQLFK